MEFQKSGRRRFMEFQKYGLFTHRCRFLEFHLYSILFQFSNLLNSKNRHYFQNFRFVYFQEYFLFLKWTDFWNSNSWVYLVSIPISGIPNIWELHVYQYLAMRVKCQIVPWYLKIPIFCHWVSFSSPTLYSLDPQIFQLQSLFFRNWHKKEQKRKSIPFTRISLNFSLN